MPALPAPGGLARGGGEHQARRLRPRGVLGLAPAAHCANRTGRIFTGTRRSGSTISATAVRACPGCSSVARCSCILGSPGSSPRELPEPGSVPPRRAWHASDFQTNGPAAWARSHTAGLVPLWGVARHRLSARHDRVEHAPLGQLRRRAEILRLLDDLPTAHLAGGEHPRGVEAVITDEVHAVAVPKRGSHLATAMLCAFNRACAREPRHPPSCARSRRAAARPPRAGARRHRVDLAPRAAARRQW